MGNSIDKFMKKHNLSNYHVAKISNISESTIRAARKKPLENITIKTISALGVATDTESWEVLNFLMKEEMK